MDPIGSPARKAQSSIKSAIGMSAIKSTSAAALLFFCPMFSTKASEQDWLFCIGSDFNKRGAIIAGPFESTMKPSVVEEAARKKWSSQGVTLTVQCPLQSSYENTLGRLVYAKNFLEELGFFIKVQATL